MSVPDLIGRYRLGQRLGSGGFAVVWLAHDESLDTWIAIKIMADNLADRMDLRERFLTEARMLRRASSSRVVQVFDIGELPDGRPFFVMEFADRGTLADRVKVGQLPLVEALRTTAEVARGAAELHRAGIVHRDLKPSNVLITSTPDGGERLLVADLGVAKNLAQASGLTMSVGSAGYMAPEQSGPNSGVDVRADVYSLGAIGYRLITGEHPALPGYVLSDRTTGDLPGPVRKVLARALEVDRERRWPDAATLALELDALANAYAATPARRRRRPGRRTVASLAVLTSLLVLAGAGFGILQYRKPVPVQDHDQKISLTVPRSWKGLNGDGWNPKVLKLTAGPQPGLLVADQGNDWNDLRKNVNGAFIGRTGDPRLSTVVQAIRHPDCASPTAKAYGRYGWSGEVRRWDGCIGSGHTVLELSLQNDRAQQVYIQIRRADGLDTDQAVDLVVRHLKLTG